jgi:hypothetical protein
MADETALDVRFGSKADTSQCNRHVCFAPESGHVRCTSLRPLWAKSGHRSALDWLPTICLNCSSDKSTLRLGFKHVDSGKVWAASVLYFG